MSNPLRSNLQFEFISNEVISADTTSRSVNLGETEGPISIMAAWENGVSVDMTLSLLVSNNNVHFTEIPDSVQTISGATGVHMWDLYTGVEFVKVQILVTGGSATLYIELNAKTRN